MVAKEKSAKAQKMMLAINIITNVLKISHKIFYRWIFHSEMLQQKRCIIFGVVGIAFEATKVFTETLQRRHQEKVKKKGWHFPRVFVTFFVVILSCFLFKLGESQYKVSRSLLLLISSNVRIAHNA